MSDICFKKLFFKKPFFPKKDIYGSAPFRGVGWVTVNKVSVLPGGSGGTGCSRTLKIYYMTVLLDKFQHIGADLLLSHMNANVACCLLGDNLGRILPCL